ncbi:unnamed protein product [Adineta steineri]|uniref:Uncharacterized protein n=1 Tax=Adineta steineri TaxID=433720 RepID=A0A818VQP0_9BILA|nr:unnamed protein product [Adineta steineri]CAF3714644.1 unnamed protein product [Adineta steineri]
MNFCYTETITTEFRPTDIEIKPHIVILNSTSTVNFTCFNYQTNNSSLEASLSKNISSNEIKLFTNPLNTTAIHIRLESTNYVGIFYLLCYSNGEQSKGTRADIIVVDEKNPHMSFLAAPGVLQLAEKCRVYDRQYIKCVIRAPTIARAVQNDFPVRFDFKEAANSPEHMAYRPQFKFLRNESNYENLIFKWQPAVDGEFPSGVRMQMKAMLPHFEPSSYNFDMTPVFRIKPRFNLRAISSNQVEMSITSLNPSAFCEKTLIPKLTATNNQTWTVVESNRNNILIDNLSPNSMYHICMKCRQIYSDPDGVPECQEIKTLSRLEWFLQNKFFIIVIAIVVVLLFIAGLIYFFRRKICNGKKRYEQPYYPTIIPSGRYYRSIADITEVIDQCAAPEILS